MKKRVLSILLCSMLTLALVTGCQSKTESKDVEKATTADSEKENNSFTIAISSDPGNNLSVLNTDSRAAYMAIKMVYSPLYFVTSEGTDFYLADSMEPSEDGLTYTMKLKKDVTWSDGESFTADDVIFSLSKFQDEKSGSINADALKIGGKAFTMEAVDDTTITFTLPSASSSFEEMLSGLFIMPKHIYENVEDLTNCEENANPVGTGPYTLDEYKEGQYIKYKKNEEYFGGAAKMDTVVLRVVEDDATTKKALEKGEINAWSPTPADMEELDKNENLNSYTYSEGMLTYLAFNVASEKVQDENLRKGIMYALDRSTLIKAAYTSEDYAKANVSFLPADNKFWSDDVEQYNTDETKAKELIGKANVPAEALKFCYPEGDSIYENMALIVQEESKAVGVDIELCAIDFDAYYNAVNDPESTEYDMFLNSYIYGNDPYMYAPLFVSTGDNTLKYNNEELDAIFKEGGITLDDEKRTELYAEAQKLVSDEGIMYPICDEMKIFTVSADVKGVDEAGFIPIFGFGDITKLSY